MSIIYSYFSIILFLAYEIWNAEAAESCPIGYNLKYTGNSIPLCYMLKGPEKFEEKFKDCIGNKYTLDLIRDLKITHNGLLWGDHKTLYPGGIFIDMSYTNSTGYAFPKIPETNSNWDQDLCTVLDPHKEDKQLISTSCDDKVHRYCIIEAYSKNVNSEGCADNFVRYKSPRSTCLANIEGVEGGAVRATWGQAQKMCNSRSSSLLQRGWRYANHWLHQRQSGEIPLGIFMSYNDKLFWSEPEDSIAEVPDSEWSFNKETFSVDTTLVALNWHDWILVNSSAIFFSVVCEKPVFVPELEYSITETDFGQLLLEVRGGSTDYKSYPQCFTDSAVPYQKIYVAEDSYNLRIDATGMEMQENQYALLPKNDGYYWCTNTYSILPRISTSNKYLYIREKESVKHLYAIKFKRKDKYNLKKLDIFLRIWMKKLAELVFLRTNYLKIHGKINATEPYGVQRILKRFKGERVGVFEEDKIFRDSKIKRIYVDRKTVLVHTEMSADMDILMPVFWEELQIIFMKPVYYCRPMKLVPSLSLGESRTIEGCKTFTCVGDFNEGVQLVETISSNCTSEVTSSSTELTREVTMSVEQTTLTTPTTTDIRTTDLEQTTDYEFTTEDYGTTTTLPTTEYQIIMRQSEVVSTVTMPQTTDVFSTNDYFTTIRTTTPESIQVTALPRPPQDHVNDVLSHLEDVLQHEVIEVDAIRGTFDEVDEMLSIKEHVEIPGNFLTMMDEIGARTNLNGSKQVITVRSNIAMMLADAEPDNPIRGMRIATRSEEAFSEQAFHILTDANNETHLESISSEAVIYLPESVSDIERRISFLVFRDQRPFLAAPGYEHYRVNSRVLSVKVENLTHFQNGERIDIHFLPIEDDLERNITRTCAYWLFFENGTGSWSQDGCVFIPARNPGLLDTCRCTHLTHFAEVLIPRALFSEENERALEILSITGCCISIFGLLMIGLTAVLFRSWRRDFNNKIWLNLCVAIFILVICFLIVTFSDFQYYNLVCMFTGIALHYSVLCSFCWMFVAAIISYRRLVLVFTRDASHKLFRACAFAYGVPFAIFGILLSVDPHAYMGRFEETTPSGSFCYPSGLALWLTVYVPVAGMLLANCILFALIVRSVFATKHIQRHGDTNDALRCASVSCLLVFLFGLPWIFGLFAQSLVFAYLFTLTATMQGFVLFLFFVIGNKKTRELWMNKLKIRQSRKVPVTSSTGYRGVNTITIEGNSSKPRSLAGTDDSRFS